MSTNPENPQVNLGATQAPSPSEATAALNTALASADSAATSGVQNLQLVHQARLSQLSRTAAALKAQYGAADPRVIRAEAAVTARASIVAHVTALNQQVATPEPTVATTGWALHGRVFNANLQAVGSYTVFLVDEQKTYQEQIGFAYTDNTGYFLLNYTPPAGQASSQTPIFIEIVNPKAQPIYIAATAFQPSAGSATYQNITLPAGEKPLGDPPAAIRKIAFPAQTEKS